MQLIGHRIRNEHHFSEYAYSVFYSLSNTLFCSSKTTHDHQKPNVDLESTSKNTSIKKNK